mgnify:CR=1 FL=1
MKVAKIQAPNYTLVNGDCLDYLHQIPDKSVDLIPAGLQYTIYTHHNKVTRIKLTDSTGQALDENKRYRVGMNSYIASSYQFDKFLPHQEMPIKAVDGLIKYLNQQQIILPHNQRRGIIVEE